MNNIQLNYGLTGLLIGAVAVWLLMTATNGSGPGMMSGEIASQDHMAVMGQIDAHFIEQMIPHHEDAITMAELALQKAQREEIKQLAQSIIDSQGKEIEQMRDWYKEWYGRELPMGDQVMQHHGMMSGGGMHMGMMGDATDVERLENAADFDRAFIEEMIPHHQMAVMMASMLKAGTQRPGMQQLADNIISAQTDEIDQMRQWYGEWY